MPSVLKRLLYHLCLLASVFFIVSCFTTTYKRVLPHDEGVSIPNYDSNKTYIRIFERPSIMIAWKVIEITKDGESYKSRFLMVPSIDSLKQIDLPLQIAFPDSLYMKVKSVIKLGEVMADNHYYVDDGYELKFEIVDPDWKTIINCDIYRYKSCMEIFQRIKKIYRENIGNQNAIGESLKNAGYVVPTYYDWFTEIRDDFKSLKTNNANLEAKNN